MSYRFIVLLNLVLLTTGFLRAEPPQGPGFEIHNKSAHKINVIVENNQLKDDGTIAWESYAPLEVPPNERKLTKVDIRSGSKVTLQVLSAGKWKSQCVHEFKPGATIYINYDGQKIFPQKGSVGPGGVLGTLEHTGGIFKEGFSLKNNTKDEFRCP